jgi:WD40 repeat protein
LHKSSVVSVKFDPQSSRVVASASTDGTCHITSCYNAELDTTTDGPFGSVTSFGENLITLNAIGWVNFITFSPSGNTLCYASKHLLSLSLQAL